MASSMSCHSWLAISSCGNYKMMMMKKLSFSTFSTKKGIVSSLHSRSESGGGGGGGVILLHGCVSKSRMMGFKCYSVKEDVDDDLEMDYRLFSNLNQSTFRREPGISISLLTCVMFLTISLFLVGYPWSLLSIVLLGPSSDTLTF